MKRKLCPHCKKIKLYSEFSRTKSRRDGFDCWCKDCHKQWSINNKEYIQSYRKSKYKKNRELILLKNIKYYYKNRVKCTEQKKMYSLTAKGIYSILLSMAKHNNRVCTITKHEFIEWYNKQKKICYYCKRDYVDTQKDDYMPKFKARRLTIDRKNNEKGYVKGNIVLACRRCNNIKSNYFTEKEMLIIGKIIRKRED